MCKVQHKFTNRLSKPEDIFKEQRIKDFNNMIDGESCMDSFTNDELINPFELISVE